MSIVHIIIKHAFDSPNQFLRSRQGYPQSSISTHFPSSFSRTSNVHFPLSIHKSCKKLSHHFICTSPNASTLYPTIRGSGPRYSCLAHQFIQSKFNFMWPRMYKYLRIVIESSATKFAHFLAFNFSSSSPTRCSM